MTLPIADGHAVTVHVRLSLEDGSVVDDSFGGEPLVYQHGAGDLVKGLERALTGKKPGEECDVQVEPVDGYGLGDPEADQTLPRAEFPPEADIVPGMSFQADGPRGPVPVWVRSVSENEVTISADHPLAGQRLSFKVRVIDVREMTAEMLAAADSG